MNPIDHLRRALGTNLEGVARLRLGRGVVGNTTYAFYAAVAAMVLVTGALHNSASMAFAADVFIGIMYLIYLAGTYFFAHGHPDLAMLGDSEWLAYRQSEMAAKHHLNIDALPSTSDPSMPLIDNSKFIDKPDDIEVRGQS
jgi:hypothetical protein